jgi:lysyl endopeptidase
MLRTTLSSWTAIFLLALGTVLSSPLLASSERPLSWQQGAGLDPVIESRALPPMDTAKIAAEDAVAEAFGQPPRFAIPVELAESTAKASAWAEWGDRASWRIRVVADEAVSLNFGFRNVRLIDGAKLWIYTADAADKGMIDRFQVLGPFGPEINEKHGEFWTPVLASGDVIIELEVPASRRNEVSLELAQVNQGYRGFGQVAEGYRQPAAPDGEGKRESDCAKGDFGAKSGSCNMDVACLAPDDPWNEPTRSVARYTLQGQFLCTGSLVNNTANDRRMLFATASHCGVSPGNASTIVAYWNYEWPTCRTPGNANGTQVNPPDPAQTNSGADFLAGTRDPFTSQTCPNPGECSDFTLVEFDDPANPAFDLFWAGWDRRFTPASCGPQGAAGSTAGLCASIHHPSGDEKRITFVDSDFETGSIAFAQGVHWHAFWHPNPPVVGGIPSPQPPSIPPGVTEPGSSGSPLYTADRRLAGVLSGGPAFCGATGVNLSDFYGQLAHAWNGLGSPSTRMRDYLDPIGTNAQFIDGLGASPFRLSSAEDFVEACTSDGSVQAGIDIDADPASFRR